MADIILVNGIYTHGERSIDRFKDPLVALGHNVHDIELPLTRVLTGWLPGETTRLAKVIADVSSAITSESKFICGHSFGCELIRQATLQGAQFEHIFLFNAAVDRNAIWPYSAVTGKLFNIYSPHDFILRLGMLLPGHPFGALGRSGYEGPPDLRIVDVPNHDRCQIIGNHTCFSRALLIDKWIKFISERA